MKKIFLTFQKICCVTGSNLNVHCKYQNYKKIRLWGTKLLAKIKLEFANAEISFVYTSHLQ
jgi:hypothetical protein